MPSLKTPHPLSELIYEGVLEKPPWKTLLHQLEDYMQVPSASLVLRRPQLSDPGVTVYFSTNDEIISAFKDKGYKDSPFAELPLRKVCTLSDLVTLSQLKSLDFYQHFMQPHGISDLMGFDVYDSASHIRLRLRLTRMTGSRSFSKEDKNRLSAIVSRMDKALKLYGAYMHNSFIEGLYDELLGEMDIASLIVNEKMEIASANHQAKSILKESDGVLSRKNKLRCHFGEDQEKLMKACGELLEVASNEPQSAHTNSITIERPNTDEKWDVHIKTIVQHDMVFDDEGPKLVLLLQGTAQQGLPSYASLIEVFAVTPAEAKLIVQLLDGQTLTDAAETLGVSRNTARAQLSSIFSKTGVNRQTQLVKLVSDAFAKKWK